MKRHERTEMSSCNNWISMQFRNGHTWEEVEGLCVPPDQSETRFCELQSIGIIPTSFSFSEWRQYVHTRKQVSSASTLVAIFDRNPENRDTLKRWLLDFSMGRVTDIERLWFSDERAIRNMAKYAVCFHIAFISLDDPAGMEVGQALYDTNPDCVICYYKREPCDLSELLHSRPYEFFTWPQGKDAFQEKLEDMIERTVFSANMFSFETKKLLYCYPVRNILYFQSDLKYVHIKTALGNDADIYAKLSEIEQNLRDSSLYSLFTRTHKSFLVNRASINAVNKQNHTLKLSTGDSIPVSDAYYKTVIRELTRR